MANYYDPVTWTDIDPNSNFYDFGADDGTGSNGYGGGMHYLSGNDQWRQAASGDRTDDAFYSKWNNYGNFGSDFGDQLRKIAQTNGLQAQDLQTNFNNFMGSRGLDPYSGSNQSGMGVASGWWGPQTALRGFLYGNDALTNKYVNPQAEEFQQKGLAESGTRNQNNTGGDWDDIGQILGGLGFVLGAGGLYGGLMGGAGEAGAGAAGGFGDALDSSLASGNYFGGAGTGDATWADALDSSLTSTGSYGLGQGAAEGGAAGLSGINYEGSGGGQGAGSNYGGTNNYGNTGDIGSLNSNVPVQSQTPSYASDAAGYTMPDTGSVASGGENLSNLPTANEAYTPPDVWSSEGASPTTNTASMYETDPYTYSPSDASGFNNSQWTNGYDLNGGGDRGLFDKLKGGLKSMGDLQKSPYYQVPKTLFDIYGNRKNAQMQGEALNRGQQMADPFGPQRAKYQGLLADSYDNPTGLYNSAPYQSLANIFGKQISARDAAAGRNSQYAARQLEMQDHFNAYLDTYRKGLQQAAGTGIAPNVQSLAGLYQNAGNANKAQYTSLANPQLWQSLINNWS